MKKIIIGVTTSLALLLASGCTQEKPVDKPNAEQKVKEEAKKETLQSEDIYAKYLEATKELKSLHIISKIKQDGGSPVTTSDMTIDMRLINGEQKEMHFKMSADNEGTPLVLTEVYLDKENLYMQNDMTSEGWLKTPSNQFEGIFGDSMNMESEFDKMSSFNKEFEVKEDGNSYILSLTKGEQDIPKIIEQLETNGGDTTLFDMIEVKEFKYTYTIDKKTFLPNKIFMSIKGDMKGEDTPTPFAMEADTSYDQFNEVPSIEVPKEVVEKAIPFVE